MGASFGLEIRSTSSSYPFFVRKFPDFLVVSLICDLKLVSSICSARVKSLVQLKCIFLSRKKQWTSSGRALYLINSLSEGKSAAAVSFLAYLVGATSFLS